MRIFEEHIKRKVQSLDGFWQFSTDPESKGESEGWQSGLPHAHTVSVPSVWNTEQGLLTYEGVAWYERSFHTFGGTLRFCFGAVMTDARVWLDGELIGSHYGGFTAFDIIVPDVNEGEHRLTVRVDNSFDAQSIPQAFVDWYHYGGITRSVSIETLEGICVLSHRFEYTLSEDLSEAVCTPVLKLYNAKKRACETTVSVNLDGTEHLRERVSVRGRKTESVILPSFTLKGIRLWSEGAPQLYGIKITTDTDDLFDRVGFRKVEIVDRKILLNGRETELRGVNRHEEHPEFGFAFPPSLMKRDMDLALEMGCNSLRGSHYPNAKAFVDLLDENGVMFWSEIPIWGCGFPDSALTDPVVIQRGLNMHQEMIEQYYNHPCIVIWGMHNEIYSHHQSAYPISKLYYEYLKENGGNRLVVYATCHPMDDICLEFCDAICINQYFGWYYGYEDNAWEKFLDEFCARAQDLGMSHKPIIMSEFGCAAMAGCHDDENILWCEENQAKQIKHCLELFHSHEAVAGSFIWQLFDMRTSRQAGLNRARGFNNKGLMNEHRKPKLAYYAAQKCYREFKEKK